MTLLAENLYITSNNDPNPNPEPNPNHEKNTKEPNLKPKITSSKNDTKKVQSIVYQLFDKFYI